MVNLDNEKAISEVNEILKQLDSDALKKLPRKLINEFEENASIDVSYIKPEIPLENLNLQDETKEILALISYNYFCDSDEKIRWNEQFEENERIYQEEINNKYGADKLFSEQEETENIQINTSEKSSIEKNKQEIAEYKESFFKKILNKIKSFFK